MDASGATFVRWYDPGLVALSVVVAVVGSYVALDLAGRVHCARGRARSAWWIGAACVQGVGIWAMHYIGMAAFHLPVATRYHLPTVAMSYVIAFACSGFALYVVIQRELTMPRALAAGVVLGAGISGLHYAAMAAMRQAADMHYAAGIVALSVLIAVAHSFAGLWLAFRLRDKEKAETQKIFGAVVVGAGIAAMHYTAMGAATFVPSSIPPDFSHAIAISTLGGAALVVVTLTAQAAAVLTSFMDRRLAEQTATLRARESFSSQLLRSQDEERRRIARDLHENTAQSLVALKMNLANIRRSTAAGTPATASAIRESIELTEQLLKEVRTLSYLLYPPLLEEAGLVSAIRWCAEGFQQRSGIKVRLEVPQEIERLPIQTETAAFRIVQECLTNIHRHSGSTVATIRISKNSEGLKIEVQDEGRGMAGRSTAGNPRSVNAGVGILGMQERVRQLGGALDIRSTSAGTTITAMLPLDRKENWQKSAS